MYATAYSALHRSLKDIVTIVRISLIMNVLLLYHLG
nr:MAG TPA: hypothetical protein [Caudoviricetes sp.]